MQEASSPAAASVRRGVPQVQNGAAKVDLYRSPHKGLRLLLSNLLVSMGQAGFEGPEEIEPLLTDVGRALWACDRHIEHEERHVRPVLMERAPNTVSTLDAEHEGHAHQVAELRAIVSALRGADSPEGRMALGRTLYLHFSVFVAETLAHMAYEERVVQPLLDRLFSVEELVAIHQAIVASIPPEEMIVWLRAVLPASSRRERAAMLEEVRANAPPEAFDGILHDLRSRLSAADFGDLAERLALTSPERR